MASSPPGPVTVAEAARHSVLFAASAGLVVFAVTVGVGAGNYGSLETRMLQFGELALVPTLWVLVFASAAQFALIVRRRLIRRWEFAWRAGVASWVGIAAGFSGYLAMDTIFGTVQGSGGSFDLVIWYLIGFTFVGGPAFAGLLAALLRPRRFATKRAEQSESERRGTRRNIGYVLLCAGAAVSIGLVGSSALVANHDGMEYGCLVAGPHPTEPPLAVVSEASGIVTGSFSLWPVGRQCEWDRADGLGTVIADSGAWGTTVFAGISGLVALFGGGLVLGSSPNSSRRGTDRPTPTR